MEKNLKGFITASGTEVWTDENGQYHNEQGPAYIGYDGSKYWYIHGMHHREDGPAIEYSNGSKSWWKHGIRHNLNGPAIGQWWYIDGIEYLEEEYREQVLIRQLAGLK